MMTVLLVSWESIFVTTSHGHWQSGTIDHVRVQRCSLRFCKNVTESVMVGGTISAGPLQWRLPAPDGVSCKARHLLSRNFTAPLSFSDTDTPERHSNKVRASYPIYLEHLLCFDQDLSIFMSLYIFLTNHPDHTTTDPRG